MAALYVTLIGLLVGVAHARLVFPPGSDVGYIVSDLESKFDDRNGINDLGIDDDYAERLLQRGEREAVDVVESALLRTIKGLPNVFEMEKLERNQREPAEDSVGKWPGKWFPHPPQVAAESKKSDVPADLPENMKDDKHGVAMGIPHIKCDNGKINLTVDWDESPVNYTCFDPKRHRLPVQEDLKSVQHCIDVPSDYVPQHYCMDREITYNVTLPVIGSHRPIWPVYGEYIFTPPQRWLHSIEHGGIVMLYHPCAEPVVVQRLRKLLVDCFRKHIITPYTLLTPERPLALVAWGCSLEMATVDDQEVKTFIKERALHGLEGHLAKDGSYKAYLISKAEYPPGSDGKDRNICPMDQA